MGLLGPRILRDSRGRCPCRLRPAPTYDAHVIQRGVEQRRFERFRRVSRARVLKGRVRVGTLEELPTGYRFTYDPTYLADASAPPVSLTLPRRAEPYESPHLFAFFYGLLAVSMSIAMGWLAGRLFALV